MNRDQKSILPVDVKQADVITPMNKDLMIYSLTIMLMLCAAVIVSSFTLV